ncbi:transcription initiation factor IIB family protein [Halorutilales archaeon Cl-col2-1]|nr:transcription initiation factor IIB [Halobacteria archaeon]
MVNLRSSESVREYQGSESEKEEETEEETVHECPECGSDNLVEDSERGETVCQDCGLVVEDEQVDRGPEWRAFDSKERDEKSRVGAPMTQRMHDKGLTTNIDWRDKDAFGQSLSADRRAQMKRLRKWQNRIRTSGSKERNLQFALGEIDRMSSSLNIPESTREVASMIYRRALDENLLPGRSIEGVAASVLYAACRQENIPRSLDEIAEVSRVEKQEVARTYRYVARQLNLEIGPTDPAEFVPRFASDLDLSEEVQQKASDIIHDTAEQGLLSGKSPTGYAAAAIYLASILCNEKRTQKEVAEAASVTEVTIRNRYHEQAEAIGAGV